MNCFFKDCREPPVIYCICSDVTYMCSSHIVYHQVNLPKINHSLYSLLKTVPIGKESELKSILVKTINDLNNARAELNKFHEEFNSFIIKTITSISSIKRNAKMILKDILYSSNVSLPVTVNLKFTNSVLSISMIKLFLKESKKKLKLNEFSEKMENLNEKFKFQFKNLFHTGNEKLSYFVKDTKFLVEYDTQNSVYKVKNINSLAPQGRRAAVCYVDYDKIFLYGGQSNKILNSAYYINMKTYHIECLESGIPRHSTTPIIFNQKIYVFGGWTNKPLNDCSYFDMNLRLWFQKSNLPSPQSDVSTVKLGNKILLTGNRSFLQLYYPENDYYEDTNSGIEPTNKNILIKNGGYVYLLLDKVYRAKYECFLYFEHLNKSVSFNMTSCRPVIKNNYAYFVDEDYQIYMFNFLDFSLKMIDKLKIY